VQTQILVFFPFTTAFTLWRFALCFLLVTLWEWLTLLMKMLVLPQIAHLAILTSFTETAVANLSLKR